MAEAATPQSHPAESATTTSTDASPAPAPADKRGVTRVRRRTRKAGAGPNSAGVRRQFSLGEDAIARLDAVRARTGAASRSEVIRQALKVYDFLSAEEAKGGRILIEQPDGRIIQIKIL